MREQEGPFVAWLERKQKEHWQVIEEMGQIRYREGHCVRCSTWDAGEESISVMYAVWWEGRLIYEGTNEDIAEIEWRRLMETESKRDICRNCSWCRESYKGGICTRGHEKKVSYKGSCPGFEQRKG